MRHVYNPCFFNAARFVQHSITREALDESSMNRVADKIVMVARNATNVAAAACYWRNQPFSGATVCCHFRTRGFAHRVMVTAGATMPMSAILWVHDFAESSKATGSAGGLTKPQAIQLNPQASKSQVMLRCAPCKGNQPFASSLTPILSHWDRGQSHFPFFLESWIASRYAFHPIPHRMCGHVGFVQRFHGRQ